MRTFMADKKQRHMSWLLNRKSGSGLLLGTLTLLLVLGSCNDDDQPDEVDCQQEAEQVSIEDDASTGGRIIQFSIAYPGDLPVGQVAWDFGDGTKDSGIEVSHLYTNSGTYEVQAQLVLGIGVECPVTTTTSVSIQ
jgi:hypothetical protein